MTPLQFKGVPAEVNRKAEGKQFVSDDMRLGTLVDVFFLNSPGPVTLT
jgi:hypothetical protein